MLDTELLGRLEMSRSDRDHRHVEGSDRLRGQAVLGQLRHEGRMLLEVSNGRAGHEAKCANGFEQHEAVGDFCEGDNGRAAMEDASFHLLEKGGTGSGQHRLRKVVNENIGVDKEVPPRGKCC